MKRVKLAVLFMALMLVTTGCALPPMEWQPVCMDGVCP